MKGFSLQGLVALRAELADGFLHLYCVLLEVNVSMIHVTPP